MTLASEIETLQLRQEKPRKTGSLAQIEMTSIRITRNLRNALLGVGEPHIDFPGVGTALIALRSPFGNTRLFASVTEASICARLKLWRVSLSLKKAVSCLATAAGFVATLSSSSLGQQFRDVSTEVGLIAEAKKSWGNPIWGDINNDGFLDLIVPTHSSAPFVYLNNAGNTFTDIRATSGIGPSDLDSLDWRGFAFGDYDGDGNLDLYIAETAVGRAQKRDLLFKGHGDGTFENVTQVAGIETSNALGQCAFWVDYDNDGKLDLFVKNWGSANRLYKNNGDGTFTESANSARLDKAASYRHLGAYHGTICSFADYDNDGFMDVAFSGLKNALYRNNGSVFVNVSASAGIKALNDGRGIAWGDYNNDGLLDFYVSRKNTASQGDKNSLYRNNGDGTFTNVAQEAGVIPVGDTWTGVWGDYDNDGFLDLFVTDAGVSGVGNANHLYHNNGDGTFTDRAAEEGVALQDDVSLHKGAAWADYNNDGFLDLLIQDGIDPETGLHRLFKNNGNSNHFIKVNLNGVQANSRGIGARVTVTSSTGMSFRQNNGGGGGEDASQGSEPLHFGIGTATEATVEVKWPSGIVDTVSSVAADSTLTVVEGSAPTPTPTPTPTSTPTPTPTNTPTPTPTDTPTPTPTPTDTPTPTPTPTDTPTPTPTPTATPAPTPTPTPPPTPTPTPTP